jgi:hypothetical protein
VVMRYEVSGMTSNDGLVGIVEDGDRANGDEIYEVAGMSSSVGLFGIGEDGDRASGDEI